MTKTHRPCRLLHTALFTFLLVVLLLSLGWPGALPLRSVSAAGLLAPADTTAQALPFSQDWTNTGLITANDDWSGVPGIMGYLGDYAPATQTTGVDPQTLLTDWTTVAVDVIANQTGTGLTTGGVAEFHIADPVVALQGSGTADAPFLLLNLNTTGFSGIQVAYNLRDIDGAADNAVQQVALHYRVGNSGDFVNVPGGYVADATTGPSLATLVTPVSAALPAAADNQPLVQVRILTTNAVGSDEWVGVDDISITGTAGSDAAPTVTVTVPADGATGVALDANIDITFSEAVNTSGAWFTIACTTSGSHAAAVSGGPTAWTLNPGADFVAGESCTVTLVAANITDQDADDPPDNMAAGYSWTFGTVAPAAEPKINEFSASTTGTDVEFVEVYGAPGTDYSAYKILEIEGDSGASCGTVDEVISVGTTDAGGLWLGSLPANALENGSITLLLVKDFSGAPGNDLDTDNDGTFDLTPWSAIADAVAVNDGGATDRAYGAPVLGVAYDGLTYAPGGASRYPDGLDTEAATDWVRNDFDLAGIPGYTGTLGPGEALNTPGASNAIWPLAPKINEFSASTTGTDVEFVEVYGSPSADYAAYRILEIEGDSGSPFGTVDEVIAVGSTDAGGFWLQNLAANALENGTITLLLVKDFSGALGNDLDTNNDGAFDVTPWSAIVDAVAVNDGGAGDLTYGVPALGVAYDGLAYAPGGASRIPDGLDTDTAADWMRNDFDLAGIPPNVGTPVLGEALNTPGATNQAYTPPTEVCGDPYTAIHDVQGAGLASPLVGTEVAVEGIVVGDFQNNAAADNGDLNGFHLQAPAAEVDADANTSEGIFIYYPGGATDVLAGDRVRLRGPVSEYYGTTEITVGQLWVCSNGNALPAATPVTLPVASLDDFEPYEGMLVTFPQTLTISEYYDFDRYGEVVLTTDRQNTPTAVYEPGSPEQAALALANSLSRITLDDGRTAQNPDPAIHPNGLTFDMTNLFRGGDTVAGVTGVMDWYDPPAAEDPGYYRIQPTQGATYTPVNIRPPAPAEVGGSLKVASANTLNYFRTLDTGAAICGPAGDMDCRGANDALELKRQRAKLVAALATLDADVVGLMEMENSPNDLPIIDLLEGVDIPDPEPGLNDLVGAGTYGYIATGAIGTDAIRQVLIYKTATVTPLGAYAILDSTVDPRFLDDYNRPVLAQTFRENATGGVFTLAVNHLKSKGSDCNAVGDPDLGDGTGNCNLTRKAAAEALADWLASDPTGSGDDDYLIIGDLNSYDMEDPIDALLAAGYTDLIRQFEGDQAYSYVFDGQVGYLDYGLANASLIGEVAGATSWHINADEPDLINYDITYKQPAQVALYAADAYRAADHDPILIGLNLTAGKIVIEKQTLPDGAGPSFAFSGALTADLADGQVQALEVPTGTFTVSEMVPAGWDLTDITCTDPTANSTGLTSAAVATYTVEPGETVTCTFTNTQRGNIVVEKETLPDGAPESFAFSGAWSGSLSDGQSSLLVEVPAGSHTVSEMVSAGWDLTDITCTDPTANSAGLTSAAVATYTVEPGETVTCTFTNTQRGKIVVEKETVPDGAADSFAFSGPWSGSLSDGQWQAVEVLPGTHAVTETVPAVWNLTDITCIDPTADSTWDVATAAARYEVAPGETVTCTFTNTERGRIIVEKQTLPDGAEATFHFSGTLTADLADGQSESQSVRPGTYQVSEVVPEGWDLTGIECSDGDSSGDLATATATFRVKAGETVRCVFTNTQRGRIVVEKQTDPDGDPTEFSFSGRVNGLLRDGERLSRRVPPGTYHVTEMVPEGWTLLTLWCQDPSGDSSGKLATATATYRVAPGETVRCIFGNTKLATAVVEKQTLPDGTANLFQFEGVAPGAIGDGGRLVAGGLLPGGYRAAEVMPDGWLLSAVTCSDDDSRGNPADGEAIFHLSAGEVVTCTFTNAQKGSITVVKDAVPDSGQPFFFSGDLGSFSLVDNATANRQTTFLDLAPGKYQVEEGAAIGWPLTEIACTDPDSGTVVDLAAATATIDLDAGGAIVCTFTNRGQADLSLTKTAEPEEVQRGEPVSYTLTIANAGPAAVAGVVVTDVVPAELEGVWFEASREVTPTGTIPYRWELGTLGAGETVVIRVYGTVRTDLGAEFSFENAASVGNGSVDPAPGNNSAAAVVWVADGAPVAVDDAYSTAMDTVLSIAPASVLDNDLDPEGDPLTVVLVSGPSHGTLVLNADGTFVYTPDPGFVGTDSFLYYVTDGWQQSNVARVTITVTQAVHRYFLPVVMREYLVLPGQ